MRLLLVGDDPSDISRLLAVFPEGAPTVTHCADASMAMVVLLEARWEFDWIILAGGGADTEARFASLVAELDRPIRVGVLDGSRPSLSVVCAARNSGNGVHFLRCVFSRPAVAQIHQRSLASEDWSILEYHAPYRRGRKPSLSALTVWSPVSDGAARKRSRVVSATDVQVQVLRKSAGRGER